jgi:hypothetical protein
MIIIISRIFLMKIFTLLKNKKKDYWLSVRDYYLPFNALTFFGSAAKALSYKAAAWV